MTITPFPRFRGSPFGDFSMGDVIYFYDEPQLFHCNDQAGNRWLALALDQDQSDRRSSYLLTPISTAQHAALPGAPDIQVLQVMRQAALQEGWVFYESWDESACIKARKPSPCEIEDYF